MKKIKIVVCDEHEQQVVEDDQGNVLHQDDCDTEVLHRLSTFLELDIEVEVIDSDTYEARYA